MKRVDVRGIVGVALLMAGAIALVGGSGVGAVVAADTDRRVYEPDEFDQELEYELQRALGRLDDLEVLEDLDGLGAEIASMVEEILQETALHIDGDWPDRIYIDPDRIDVSIDTREIARSMERMARELERSFERGELNGRAWRIDRDRATIESEMRDLERRMQRLQRELERMEEDGDI